MKSLILTLSLLFFFFTSKIMAQNTEHQKEEEKINLSDTTAQKQLDFLLKNYKSTGKVTKQEPIKITDIKGDNQKQKEICECLGLLYIVSFNGYFLGCF